MPESPVLLIHYQPLEVYPPAANGIRFLKQQPLPGKVYCISTRRGDNLELLASSAQVHIIRTAYGTSGQPALKRLFRYCWFYWVSFFTALKIRPSHILYYESISAFPALLYAVLFPRVKLMVHYHEYETPEQINKGMFLVKRWHNWEKKLYPYRFSWISHTNAKRMELFLKDHPGIPTAITHILPNYPPAEWQQLAHGNMQSSGPLRLVYVGALSFTDLFLEELLQWVHRYQEDCSLDIYSFGSMDTLKQYLEKHQIKNVSCKGPVNYTDLPRVLSQYQVGLILYRGNTLNYIYNEPNKLFEYLALGLDVWIPNTLKGSLHRVREEQTPKIIALNFDKMDQYQPWLLYQREGLSQANNEFSYQQALAPLRQALLLQ